MVPGGECSPAGSQLRQSKKAHANEPLFTTQILGGGTVRWWHCEVLHVSHKIISKLQPFSVLLLFFTLKKTRAF